MPYHRRRIALATLLQVLARLAGLGCGLALMGYLSRNLGLADYGRYALAVVLVNWISTLIGLFTGSALVRLVAGQVNGRRYAVTMLQWVALVGMSLGVLVFVGSDLLASTLKSPGIGGLLRILSINIPMAAVTGVHLGFLTAQGKNALNGLGIILGWGIQLGLAIFFVGQGWAASGAAGAVVGAGLAQWMLARFLSGLPLFSQERVRFSELWLHIRLLGGPQFLLRILQNMDLLAVKYFLGSPATAGVYAGAQNIGIAAMMMFEPSTSIVLQTIAKSCREENSTTSSQVAVGFLRAALIYGGILVALGIFSREIAVFLLGAKFEESGSVLALLLVAVAFRVQASAGRTLIAAAGEVPSIMISLGVLFLGAWVAFAYAIPRGGILAGAAIAMAVAIVSAFIFLIDGVRLMRIRFPWATLLRVGLATMGTAVVGYFLRQLHLHILATLTLTTLFYAGLLLLLREWRIYPQWLSSAHKLWPKS